MKESNQLLLSLLAPLSLAEGDLDIQNRAFDDLSAAQDRAARLMAVARSDERHQASLKLIDDEKQSTIARIEEEKQVPRATSPHVHPPITSLKMASPNIGLV